MIEIVARLPVMADLKRELQLTEAQHKLKRLRNEMIARVITGRSDKFLLIIGPCSADDPNAVMSRRLRCRWR